MKGRKGECRDKAATCAPGSMVVVQESRRVGVGTLGREKGLQCRPGWAVKKSAAMKMHPGHWAGAGSGQPRQVENRRSQRHKKTTIREAEELAVGTEGGVRARFQTLT